MILGGFFFQARWTEKGPAGEIRGLEIDGYDPVNKGFVSNWYLSDGSRFSGVLTVIEKTWTDAGKWLTAGKQYPMKASGVFAPDLASVDVKFEISSDGKTWTPVGEEKWTKVQPAAQK
jgi:hypothetical protein